MRPDILEEISQTEEDIGRYAMKYTDFVKTPKDLFDLIEEETREGMLILLRNI